MIKFDNPVEYLDIMWFIDNKKLPIDQALGEWGGGRPVGSLNKRKGVRDFPLSRFLQCQSTFGRVCMARQA